MVHYASHAPWYAFCISESSYSSKECELKSFGGNRIRGSIPRLRRNGSSGRRLKLHPDDYFTPGMQRGTIKERWYTPPGVSHAPGSYLTFEPQWNADVNSVHENIVAGEIYPWDFLVDSCPDDRKRDMDYIMDLLDWEKNIDPDYRRHYYRPPIEDAQKRAIRRAGHRHHFAGDLLETTLTGARLSVHPPVSDIWRTGKVARFE